MIASAIAALAWGALAVHARKVAAATMELTPRASSPPLAPGSVVAFVPARNEAEVIEPCVRALLAQGGSLARVIAIDDKSTDRTGEILRSIEDPRLTVLEGRGPGPGECGKPAALRDAVEREAPMAEWLLFLDADVVLEPGALEALLSVASERDLISVLPRLELGSVVERWLMPSIVAIVTAAHPASKIADPHSRVAFANGQLILVRREVYARAGGHAAVVREILEDVRLAERVKAAGGRLLLADGRRLAKTRMYASVRELVEGWSKNLYLLVGGRAGPALAWMTLTTLAPSLGWIALLVDGGATGIAAFAFVTAIQMALRARMGAPVPYVLFAPLAALAVDLIILRSARILAAKRVPWKGRVIS